MTQSVYQKSSHLAIRSANCLNTISPLAQCSTCQQICPQQALQLRDGQWHAGHCSLCGLCTVVCPTQVFQIDQPSLLQYESKRPWQLWLQPESRCASAGFASQLPAAAAATGFVSSAVSASAAYPVSDARSLPAVQPPLVRPGPAAAAGALPDSG